MQTTFVFPDVHAYEARNNYWVGRILEKVSGASLYQTTHVDRPWGFSINCDDLGRPHTVQFENGTIWSFCAPKVRHIKYEWPMFVKDFQSEKGRITARVTRIFSDSMHLTLASENACMDEMMIWYHPARVLSDEYALCVQG